MENKSYLQKIIWFLLIHFDTSFIDFSDFFPPRNLGINFATLFQLLETFMQSWAASYTAKH